MSLIKKEIINEYIENESVNPNNWSWWKFVNLKYDRIAALSFANFFYPEIIEKEGCFLLKDNFDQETFDGWKRSCGNDRTCVEKMMNLYEVADFFHINQVPEEDDHWGEQIEALGDILKLFWSLSFEHRFPDKEIAVSVFREYDDDLFITVYQNR